MFLRHLNLSDRYNYLACHLLICLYLMCHLSLEEDLVFPFSTKLSKITLLSNKLVPNIFHSIPIPSHLSAILTIGLYKD